MHLLTGQEAIMVFLQDQPITTMVQIVRQGRQPLVIQIVTELRAVVTAPIILAIHLLLLKHVPPLLLQSGQATLHSIQELQEPAPLDLRAPPDQLRRHQLPVRLRILQTTTHQAVHPVHRLVPPILLAVLQVLQVLLVHRVLQVLQVLQARVVHAAAVHP
jgi:hypothetical protein